jgi:hypothetical protein
MGAGYTQIYAIIIIVWATLVTESWKRKENELANKWLMRDFQDTTTERKDFRPHLEVDDDLRNIVRSPRKHSYLRFLLIGLPVTIAFMALTVFCVLATKNAYDNAYLHEPPEKIPFIASFGVSLANTFYITFFAIVFNYVSEQLTEYEEH